jgi:hypothetical protein
MGVLCRDCTLVQATGWTIDSRSTEYSQCPCLQRDATPSVRDVEQRRVADCCTKCLSGVRHVTRSVQPMYAGGGVYVSASRCAQGVVHRPSSIESKHLAMIKLLKLQLHNVAFCLPGMEP